MASYDRLTQLDNSFLVFEDESTQMHVGSTAVYQAEPLRRSDGTLDIERLREYVASRLDRVPRYRQRLAYTPIQGHPVWVDDARFNIRYHVRHARLPRPGSDRQLKRTTARVFSQRLDRDKPLWEFWVIEGLEGDRIAIHSKIHHCMIDGVAGAEILAAILTPEPVEKVETPAIWQPRPLPSRLELGLDEFLRVGRAPQWLAGALLRLVRDEDDTRHRLGEQMRAVGRLLASGVSGTTPAPFNRPVRSYRRLDWMAMPLDRVRAVRHALGCTVNDVVLATSAGGIGSYLRRYRGFDTRGAPFRVMAPVSVRRPEEQKSLGNRVSAWTVDLPVDSRDPLEQIARIHGQTETLKESKQAQGAEVLARVTEWTGSVLLSLASRLVTHGTPFNTIITNIPGPQIPLYLLDSRLLENNPHVPLMGTLGLAISLFSYDGKLFWGFSADWEIVPDLHDLVCEIQRAFDALCAAARV